MCCTRLAQLMGPTLHFSQAFHAKLRRVSSAPAPTYLSSTPILDRLTHMRVKLEALIANSSQSATPADSIQA